MHEENAKTPKSTAIFKFFMIALFLGVSLKSRFVWRHYSKKIKMLGNGGELGFGII